MKIAETIRTLHEKQRAADGNENAPIPGFGADDIARLEAACGHALPAELKAVLQTPGIFAFAPEVFIEDVGYVALGPPDTVIADAENLRNAIAEYGWKLPPCCSLSLVNNEFLAYDLENGTVLAIDGDDGDATDLGCGVEALLEQYAELWAAQIEG